MKTTKPLSTISYNTPSYLAQVLQTLIDSKIIDFFFFIEHEPEDDENGKKHIHLYIEPCKAVETTELPDLFMELDLEHKDKPLGVKPFRKSVFGDAYYYFKHDVGYLYSKGQSRKYHYQDEDITTNDPEMMREHIHEIDITAYSKDTQIYRYAMNTEFPPATILHMVGVQLVKWPQYTAVIEMIRNQKLSGQENTTVRNKGEKHE